MVAITPDAVGNSLILAGIMAVVSIAATAYSLYLNWKQSKVKNQMDTLIGEVKLIHETIKNGHE